MLVFIEQCMATVARLGSHLMSETQMSQDVVMLEVTRVSVTTNDVL